MPQLHVQAVRGLLPFQQGERLRHRLQQQHFQRGGLVHPGGTRLRTHRAAQQRPVLVGRVSAVEQQRPVLVERVFGVEQRRPVQVERVFAVEQQLRAGR